MMQRLTNVTLRAIQRRFYELLAADNRRNQAGQDLIEYALIVGFIAVTAAALIPYAASESMKSIYSKIATILSNSVSQT
ncbi:MAG: Flp family type IVb pilin [Bryobacteraceae bacterium]